MVGCRGGFYRLSKTGLVTAKKQIFLNWLVFWSINLRASCETDQLLLNSNLEVVAIACKSFNAKMHNFLSISKQELFLFP